MKFTKFSTYSQFKDELALNEQELKDKKIQATYFDYVENDIIDDDKKISELLESFVKISDAHENLIEKKAVYDKVNQLVVTGETQAKIE